MIFQEINVYGAIWCPDTIRVKIFLNEHGVQFHYIDLANNKNITNKISHLNNGVLVSPTIIINKIPFFNPSNLLLTKILDLKDRLKNERQEFTCGIERPDRECGDECDY